MIQLFNLKLKDFQDSNASNIFIILRIQHNGKNWIIYDGDGSKPSTNGTWIYIENSCEIYNGMIFKAAQTMFKVKFLEHPPTS